MPRSMFKSFIIIIILFPCLSCYSGGFDGTFFITIMFPIASHKQNVITDWKHVTVAGVPHCWTNPYLIAGYHYDTISPLYPLFVAG